MVVPDDFDGFSDVLPVLGMLSLKMLLLLEVLSIVGRVVLLDAPVVGNALIVGKVERLVLLIPLPLFNVFVMLINPSVKNICKANYKYIERFDVYLYNYIFKTAYVLL